MKIMIMDLDGTLTRGDTIFNLFGLFGKRERAEQLYRLSKTCPRKAAQMLGLDAEKAYPGMDIEWIFKEIISERNQVSTESFREAARGQLKPGAKLFVGWLCRNNIVPFLVTATYAPIAVIAARRLGIPENNVIATLVEINARGNAVGFTGPVMDSEQKAVALDAIAEKTGISLECFAGLGDSDTDLPFLEKIGKAGGLAFDVNHQTSAVMAAKKNGGPDFEFIRKKIKARMGRL